MDTPTRNIEALKNRASDLARKADRTEDKYERAEAIKELSVLLLQLRAEFTTEDGKTDWTGRTYAYRSAVRELFAMSGVPRERTIKMQALTRYHIGNLLRDQLDPEQLADLGLIVESPNERSNEKRRERMGVVRAVRGQDQDIEPELALSAAEQLLRRLRPSVLEDMEPDEVADLKDSLVEIEHQLERLRKYAAELQRRTDKVAEDAAQARFSDRQAHHWSRDESPELETV